MPGSLARSGKSLVPDPEPASLVREMFEEYATGRFAKQEVLARVTERGLGTSWPGSAGNRFNRTAVTAPFFNYLAPSEGAEEKMVTLD